MKKLPCLFQRDFTDKRRPVLLRDVTPGCEWVIAGEGVPTRKYDGTACMVRAGKLYKRYDAKVHPKTGERKAPPEGFEPCCDPDPVTGHWPGWLPVGEEPESRWQREAWNHHGRDLPDGTYEACGPKLQTNPEHLEEHVLIRHGVTVLADCPRDFDGIRAYLSTRDIEGIVFHHPDGRMVKIRKDDFGMKRLDGVK